MVAIVGLMQCDGDSGDRQGRGDKVLVRREKWKLESKAMGSWEGFLEEVTFG